MLRYYGSLGLMEICIGVDDYNLITFVSLAYNYNLVKVHAVDMILRNHILLHHCHILHRDIRNVIPLFTYQCGIGLLADLNRIDDM